jgi:serine/threonine-protein kinase RsbW
MNESSWTARAEDAAFERTGAADAWSVAQFRRDLSEWLAAQLALDASRRNDVLLTVNEALTNAAEFAYGPQGGTMTMRAQLHADGSLLVVVSDRGRWHSRDPETVPNTRGRGIPLMRALADDAAITATAAGTEVALRFTDCVLFDDDQRCATPA